MADFTFLSQNSIAMEIPIAESLQNIELAQYLGVFLDAGFCTSGSLKDICEEDFDALGVKLGHRRRLQREFLRQAGEADNFKIVPLHRTTISAPEPAPKKAYRRHPKRDKNAPLKPLSGYASFANHVRTQAGNEVVSFSASAKRTGQEWQNMPSSDRTQWQLDAALEREAYMKKLNLYKKTDNYSKYENYLKEFKSEAASRTDQKPPRRSSFKDSSISSLSDRSKASPYPDREHLYSSGGSFSDGVSGHTCQHYGQESCSYCSRESTFSETPSLAYQSIEATSGCLRYLSSPASTAAKSSSDSSKFSIDGIHTSMHNSSSPELCFSLVRREPLILSFAQSEDVVGSLGVSVSWTTLTADVSSIEHAMETYFRWENPIFSTLSEKAFLADFRSGRNVYCSAALVNAILALGCRLSTDLESLNATDDEAIEGALNDPFKGGDDFYVEAQRLLDEESVPQLTTIQSMSILSIRDAICGRQSTSMFYSKESIRLAVDMHHLLEFESAQTIENEVTEAAFWGVFALDQMWSLLVGQLPYCSRDSHYVSTLGMCSTVEASVLAPPTEPLALLDSEAQKCFRKLSLLVHDSCYALQPQSTSNLTVEVRSLYKKYIEWYSSLSDDLRLGSYFTPRIIFTLIYYHFAVLLLLRPFIELPVIDSDILAKDTCAQSSDSIAILVACYDRLYNLRRSPAFLPYIILSSGIANATSDSPSPKQFHANIASLEGMRSSHSFAGKALEILVDLDRSSKTMA